MHLTSLLKSKLPKDGLNFQNFLLKSEALKLYRQLIRSSYKISDKNDRSYVVNWIREDFNHFKRETDTEKIKMQISIGYAQLRELRKNFNIY